MGVTGILCSLRLLLEGKAYKEFSESSRLELTEKFPAKQFTLSDAEDNTSGSLYRGSIADLPLLRTLLEIRQKSRNMREEKDSFVLKLKESFATPRTLLK